MVLFLFLHFAYADIAIFDSKRPLGLSNNEKIERDYYLDGGVEQGLKVGQILTVNRRVTVYDSLLNRSLGEMVVPIAKLKIVHAQRGLSVARYFAPAKASVGLEDNYVMIGDRLETSSSEPEVVEVPVEKSVAPPLAE